MGLKRGIRLYIESELRDYSSTRKEWESLQDEIIYSSGVGDDSGIRGTDVGAPTERKALKLITNRRLSQLERTIKSFERVLTNLQEDKFKLVILKYWTVKQTLTDEGMAQSLCCSLTTFYRWKDSILLSLAKEMGLVD